MTTPNYSNFRAGTSVALPDGKPLTYAELKQTELQDYYLRVIHEQAAQGKLTRPQLDSWLKRLSSKDRSGAPAVRAELELLRSAALGSVSPSASTSSPSRTSLSKPTATKRARTEQVVSLVSRGDHKRALSTAQGYGLLPTPVPEQTLKPGQSPDAHTVRAVESVASKLIVTGDWKTSD